MASTYPRWLDDKEPGFVHELCKRLTSDFDVTVLCPCAPDSASFEVMDDVKVVRYRYAPRRFETLVSGGRIIGNLKKEPWKILLLPSFLIGQLLWILWLLRQMKPNVIHAHWLIPQGIIASLISFIDTDTPILITSHGTDLLGLKSKFLIKLKRIAVSRASAITVVSSALKQEFREQIGNFPDVSVAPMGVDLTDRFYPNSLVERNDSDILFVGRLVKGKGVGYLIEAMPLVLRRFPNARLIVVGDGPERDTLERLALDLGITSKISFVGACSQSELPRYYRSAGMMVAPFLREGLGLVCVEALGCGCPVIVSDIPAVHDISNVTKGIITVPAKSIEAIAEGIEYVIVNSRSMQMHVLDGLPALKRSFGWESAAQRYRRILSHISR